MGGRSSKAARRAGRDAAGPESGGASGSSDRSGTEAVEAGAGARGPPSPTGVSSPDSNATVRRGKRTDGYIHTHTHTRHSLPLPAHARSYCVHGRKPRTIRMLEGKAGQRTDLPAPPENQFLPDFVALMVWRPS
jgi:hypothetical protein